MVFIVGFENDIIDVFNSQIKIALGAYSPTYYQHIGIIFAYFSITVLNKITLFSV